MLGLWALRNIALAPLVGLPIAAQAVAVPRRRGGERASLGWLLAGARTVVLVVFTVRAAEQPTFAFDGYPVAAMQTVQRDGLPGQRLLTSDSDAGYVILKYWPHQRVFIDDRYDMYPRSAIEAYFTLARAQPGWAAVLRRDDICVIVWAKNDPLVALAEASGTGG